jgi:5'-nucleotidase
MHILLTNDDGIHAEGLRRLDAGLREAMPRARISVCAPDREQSASSHALTLTSPLRITRHSKDKYSVTGTPTDCVLLALRALFEDELPDLVISGINHGPNMGEDILYSGTVAAAMEGTICGLPSIALSLGSRGLNAGEFETADHFVKDTLPQWLERGLQGQMLLNVNVPAKPLSAIKGMRVCKLGSRIYQDVITRKVDPRGKEYFWIGGNPIPQSDDETTDFGLMSSGWITVTPLHLDMTDYKAMVYGEDLVSAWKK